MGLALPEGEGVRGRGGGGGGDTARGDEGGGGEGDEGEFAEICRVDYVCEYRERGEEEGEFVEYQ